MDTKQMLPLLMRQSELCRAFGLGVRELRALVSTGKVRAIKICKYAKYNTIEVAAALGLEPPPTRATLLWDRELKQRNEAQVRDQLDHFKDELRGVLENHRSRVEQRLCVMTDQIGRLNTHEHGSAPARPRPVNKEPLRAVGGGSY